MTRLRNLRMLSFISFFLVSSVATGAILEKRVKFQPGQSEAKIEGKIKGYSTVDYVLAARAGQRMKVDFKASNSSAYFNILPGGSATSLFTGSSGGDHFDGTLPISGDYRIRVYLMRNAARRGDTARYELQVGIADGQSDAGGAKNPDYADGLSGGPDFWSVTGVPQNDTLNVRAEPDAGSKIVGQLTNGDVARNLGCKMLAQSRWCRIEAGGEMKFTGWVNGRYLRESSQP